jgi:hypothetical protein
MLCLSHKITLLMDTWPFVPYIILYISSISWLIIELWFF